MSCLLPKANLPQAVDFTAATQRPFYRFLMALAVSLLLHFLALYTLGKLVTFKVTEAHAPTRSVIDIKLETYSPALPVETLSKHAPEENLKPVELKPAEEIVSRNSKELQQLSVYPMQSDTVPDLDLKLPVDTLKEAEIDSNAARGRWAFSGVYRKKIQARERVQQRNFIMARNRAERLGHSIEELAAGSSGANAGRASEVVRLGDTCYLKYARQNNERGNKMAVGSVPCPGKKDWWRRDNLDEVSAARRIP